jgi:hypothetical protein
VRRAPVFLLLAAALIAGCGGASKDDYSADFRPLNKKIVALGDKIGKGAAKASGQSDREIEKEFGGYAKETSALRGELDDLDPPDDLESDHEKLGSALGDAEHALSGIENAAQEHDAQAARSSTLDLVQASRNLRAARRRLERATR